jgi:CRISPR-associated protein Cas1
MDRNYHLLNDGTLRRHQNNLRFDTQDGESKPVPVERVEALFCYGQVDFNTRLLGFLEEHDIEMHVFGWNNTYHGSFLPRPQRRGGKTLVAQVGAYDDVDHRIRLAEEFVAGSIHNMRSNVQYYDNRERSLGHIVEMLDETADTVGRAEDVDELLGIEATARRAYYDAFDAILNGLPWNGRSYNPPESEANALLSFGNSLLYGNCASAIRQAALDPRISYLHEPGQRRRSLSLDVADVMKPVVVDRTVFRTVNRSQIGSGDFEGETQGYTLSESGRRTFLSEYEKTLEKTVEHPRLDRNVSYKYLLRLEAYKIRKDLFDDERYEALRRWW